MNKLSSSFKLLSRPGQTLKAHLQGVAKLAQTFLGQITIQTDLASTAYIIGAAHDFGKSTTFFQEYVRSVKNADRTHKKNHSSLSAYFCYHLLTQVIPELVDRSTLPLIAWYVIERHHGNFTDFSLDNLGEISKKTKRTHHDLLKIQVADIKNNHREKVEQIYKELNIEPKLDLFFENIESGILFKQIKKDYFKANLDIAADNQFYLDLLLLYSALLDADKLNAAQAPLINRQKIPRRLVENYKTRIFGPPRTAIDKLRDNAAESIKKNVINASLDKRLFAITLPTGSGKTLVGLQSALILRKRIKKKLGFIPRIIYVLPFLTIIEQNHEVIAAVLEHSAVPPSPAMLLKHHHLSPGFLKSDDTDQDALHALLFTEGWHSEIVVTTFVQFFESLITYRNTRARKFHNIVNSIIILDEIQAVPRKYWKLIQTMITTLGEKYNTWIILMSATNPLIFEPTQITELVPNPSQYYTQFNRVRYHFDLEEKSLSSAAKLVIKTFHEQPNSDVMVVMNTIQSSKDLFHILQGALQTQFQDVDYIYLSTHVLPNERLNRINRIKETKTRKLIVTTQLIEAGVDIDVDIIFRDLAPLDSIIQTAGRCNRESTKNQGKIHILKLIDDKTGRTYASYVYDKILLEVTTEIIGNIIYASEREFSFRAARQYFELCKTRASDEETVLNCIRKLQFSKIRHFRLIEEHIRNVSIFIETDTKAHQVRKEIEKILQTFYGYEQKAALLPLKRKFHNYIINIRLPRKYEDRLGYLNTLEGTEQIYFVPYKDYTRWYDAQTGFTFPEDTFDLRFI